MRDLAANDLGPVSAAYTSMRAAGVAGAHPESISKLVLSGPRDRALIEAVGGYPARLQSCVLAAWLRSGWHLSHARPAQAHAMPPPLPSFARPAARLTRRIHFDDPSDPALAGFLRSLPRKERGREIRHFISLALASRARRTP
jgi:hypothetical protein